MTKKQLKTMKVLKDTIGEEKYNKSVKLGNLLGMLEIFPDDVLFLAEVIKTHRAITKETEVTYGS